ncbi:MAG: hypothetical protein JXR70_10990 [Spirochaetales bacterium]|nr:hypothetical protein [Spirochaetales bacterium]
MIPLKKKPLIFQTDFLLFALLTLALWIFLLYSVGHQIQDHSPHDVHTQQANAWLQGRISLPQDIGHLELAFYRDNIYASFPPISTFMELPLAVFFGYNTPNTFELLLFSWLTMVFIFFILFKLTENKTLSYLGAFAFLWGSNALWMSLEGAVWHQGHLFGLFFAVTAFFVLFYSQNIYLVGLGSFFLSCAVGGRPFYLFLIVFYFFQVYKKYPKLKSLIIAAFGMVPMGAFYGIYNYIRFDSFFEFGHTYLPWSQELPDGVFSTAYFARNIKFATLEFPTVNSVYGFLDFHGRGTSVLVHSPFLLLSFLFFLRRESNIWEKLAGLASFIMIWGSLLMHESNGWYQFGYRYSVDLIPLFVVFFGLFFKKDTTLGFGPFVLKVQQRYSLVIIVAVFSVIMNIYGAFWYYVLDRVAR